jgi:hypothetical protein
MADKRWVQHPHPEHSQLSVHESQLSESKFKIERLHIQHPDGTAYGFKPKPGPEGAPLKLVLLVVQTTHLWPYNLLQYLDPYLKSRRRNRT